MKFWDSSAVVPLVSEEAGTPRYSELAPPAEIKVNARRLLRTHSLRAAAAFRLAAALVACEGVPVTMEFVCADARLLAAARLEGFSITAPEIA